MSFFFFFQYSTNKTLFNFFFRCLWTAQNHSENTDNVTSASCKCGKNDMRTPILWWRKPPGGIVRTNEGINKASVHGTIKGKRAPIDSRKGIPTAMRVPCAQWGASRSYNLRHTPRVPVGTALRDGCVPSISQRVQHYVRVHLQASQSKYLWPSESVRVRFGRFLWRGMEKPCQQ